MGVPSCAGARDGGVATRCGKAPRASEPQGAAWQHRVDACELHAAIEHCGSLAAHERGRRRLRREESSKSARSGVIEDQGARHARGALPHSALQLIAQLDRAERIDACLHQWCIRVHKATRRVLHQHENRLETNHTLWHRECVA